MKKFRKLIPAFAMLLVSAVMLGTSTFAWFSMNTTVTATGMNVTATSDTPYFVISATKTDISGSTGTATTATATTSSTSVKPVAYTTSQIVKGGTTINANSWYTGTSSSLTDGQGSNPATVSAVTFKDADYFVVHTFYVGLAANSSQGKFNLNVKLEKEASAANATKAAVVVTPCTGTTTEATSSAQEGIDWETLSGNGWNTTTGFDFVTSGSAEAKFVKVEVYVYIDGTDAGVTTNAGTVSGSLKVTINGTVVSN